MPRNKDRQFNVAEKVRQVLCVDGFFFQGYELDFSIVDG